MQNLQNARILQNLHYFGRQKLLGPTSGDLKEPNNNPPRTKNQHYTPNANHWAPTPKKIQLNKTLGGAIDKKTPRGIKHDPDPPQNFPLNKMQRCGIDKKPARAIKNDPHQGLKNPAPRHPLQPPTNDPLHNTNEIRQTLPDL